MGLVHSWSGRHEPWPASRRPSCHEQREHPGSDSHRRQQGQLPQGQPPQALYPAPRQGRAQVVPRDKWNARDQAT